jgi:hypothetical protein
MRSAVSTARTVTTVDAPTDHHELLELPGGSLIVLSYTRREHVLPGLPRAAGAGSATELR